jgi:hypothetical protein
VRTTDFIFYNAGEFLESVSMISNWCDGNRSESECEEEEVSMIDLGVPIARETFVKTPNFFELNPSEFVDRMLPLQETCLNRSGSFGELFAGDLCLGSNCHESSHVIGADGSRILLLLL